MNDISYNLDSIDHYGSGEDDASFKCELCDEWTFEIDDVCETCKIGIRRFKVDKLDKFTDELSNVIECSIFGFYTQMESTHLSYDKRYIHIFKYDSELPNNIKKLVTTDNKNQINYSILKIFKLELYGSDLNCTFMFSTQNVPGITFIIKHYEIGNRCGSCDETTWSNLMLTPIKNKDDLINYLEYTYNKKYFKKINFDSLF